MKLESTRLRYSRIRQNDVNKLHQIFSRESVTKYFVSGPDKSLEETKNRISRIESHWDSHSFGDFLVHDKASDDLVGFAGLHYKSQGGKVNIAYIVLEEHQRKGFGFEISQAMLDYGFNTLDLREIVAEIDPENAMSIKLIQKCGFEYEGEQIFLGHIRAAYKLQK